MKRYPVFALVALVFLLLVLLGSWVYLRNYAWPPGSDAAAKETAGPGSREPTEDPFPESQTPPDNQPEGGAGDTVTGPEVSEPPTETIDPIRRVPSAEAIETSGDSGAAVQATAEPDQIVAELGAGVAGIRGGGGRSEESLDEFIVSTLPPAEKRAGYLHGIGHPDFNSELERHAGDVVVRRSKLEASAQATYPEFPSVLIGRLRWPIMTEDELKVLHGNSHRQAVVYLERLPEFRQVVDSEKGWFVLPLSEKLEKDFVAYGLKIVVHSPAFWISGNRESVEWKKSNGKLVIDLDPAPAFELVVEVTPPEALESGVRAWVERHGEPDSPDADDSLYMSARVPSSGRLHFIVPQHYGELRFGVTGRSWHSGSTATVAGWGWGKRSAKVQLDLAREDCNLVCGQVKDEGGEPIKGARLESTHFGTTLYSGPDGQFEGLIPFDSIQVHRQFQVFVHGMRPEIVALETRGNSTFGVDGVSPHGPWQVILTSTVEVTVELPLNVFEYGEQLAIGGVVVSRERKSAITVKLRWNTRAVPVYGRSDSDGKLVGGVWLSSKQWQQCFQRYATGEEPKTIEVETFERAFRNR